MGIYSRYIGPKFVSCLCGMDDITAERERVIPLARGVVLEIGMGPGLNLPFYNPLLVTKVIGVDPNDAFLHLGEERQRSSRVPVGHCVGSDAGGAAEHTSLRQTRSKPSSSSMSALPGRSPPARFA